VEFSQPFRPWLAGAAVWRAPYGCCTAQLDTILGSIGAKGMKLAGVLVEPIQGRSGAVVPPPGWLAKLRTWCSSRDTLLIFDEVFTVRPGRYLADEVPCDIVCLGKAMEGASISGIFGTREVMNAWPVCDDESLHTGTGTSPASWPQDRPDQRLDLPSVSRTKGSDLHLLWKESAHLAVKKSAVRLDAGRRVLLSRTRGAFDDPEAKGS
jgi:hypothetical protein